MTDQELIDLLKSTVDEADRTLKIKRKKINKLISLLNQTKEALEFERERAIDDFCMRLKKHLNSRLFMIDGDLVGWFEEHLNLVAEEAKNGKKKVP